jgi:hypothetical protein
MRDVRHNGANGHHNNGSYIRELDPSQGLALLDKQTRRYLNMSAQEFIDAWHAGKLRDRQEEPQVARLASLIPLAT